MLKKFSSLVMAVLMVLTLSTAVTAADEAAVTITYVPETVYYSEGVVNTFTANIVLSGVETVGQFGFELDYDPTAVLPMTVAGEEAISTTKAKDLVDVKLPTWKVQSAKFDAAEGKIEFPALASFDEDEVQEVALPADGICYSVTFKTLAAKAAGISFTLAGTFKTTLNPEVLDSAVELTDNTADITIVPKPVAPTATPVDILVGEDGVARVGDTVTANYDFVDGNPNAENEDVSEVTWFLDGVAIEDSTEKTLLLDEEMVGCELSYEVLAKANRVDFDPVAESAVALADDKAVVVMPIGDYAPVAELELKKVTIGKKVELDYTLNKYANGEDASTYKWFVVEATDEASAIDAVEGAEALENFTSADPTFEKTIDELEVKGMWAVVEVTAREEIGGVVYPVDPTEPNVYYAAAEIKSQKSGGVPGGASLVTGTTETKPDVKPEEPGTDEPKPEEPGTTEPGTEDPAGSANEVGAAAFTDVDKEAYAWAYDSIDTLAKSGVIKGMTADSFGPELSTTNAQVIALVVRIAGLTAEDATTDHVDAEHWVYKEMAAAQAANILGVFGDKIDVEKATTREAAFTLLYNALKAAGVELKADAEDIAYTDAASIDANCVEAISALTKAGIINGMGDGTLAPKAEITRAQLAKILGLANAAK